MASRRTRWAVWWRRAGLAPRVLLFITGLVLFSLLIYLQRPSEDSEYLGSNVAVFLLVNVNIIVLCALLFVVGRHIVKLVFDRRRNILGSKLRSRLVGAFVAITIIPSVILFVVASGFLSRAMEGWFSSQVEAAVGGAVQVARQHYLTLQQYSRSAATELADKIQDKSNHLSSIKSLETFLDQERKQRQVFSLRVVDAQGEVLVAAQNAAAGIDDFSEPPLDPGALRRAVARIQEVRLEERGGGQFVRAYEPIVFNGQPLVLITSSRVSPELTQALHTVNDSFKEYQQLNEFKNPLKSSYLLALGMITMLILLAAIWFGFYLAREMAVPIQKLAEGTREVARGNYDFQIRAVGDDELGLLVKSFNKMTSDLKQSRTEAESRRVFIEAISANLAVAVIGVDQESIVTSVNDAARELFEIDGTLPVVGRDLAAVLGPTTYAQILPLLTRSAAVKSDRGSADSVAEQEISVMSEGTEHKVVCTCGLINSREGVRLGMLLLFDDVTDLVKAQNLAAWREVARRIAHEIKNPLTPIQLSAQRLQKLVGVENGDPAVIESAKTIVEHVDSIKRLANEFSRFARMPEAEFSPGKLNSLIEDTLAPFAENHTDIVFQFIPGNSMPENLMDQEQVRRVLINLIDNAIAAVRQENGGERRIVIKTDYSAVRNTVSMEISDTGVGVPQALKARIFEPYFTTRKTGTGLGLAIVTSIVAEHQGTIRVFDNTPRGSRFVVELPVKPRQGTQRKFGVA